MKKYLSMVLALVMVLTMISAMAVTVSAATTEDVVVYWNKFDSADGFVANGTYWTLAEAVEENGNKFIKFTLKDSMIGNFYTASSMPDGGKARIQCNSVIATLKNGRTYRLGMDVMAHNLDNETGYQKPSFDVVQIGGSGVTTYTDETKTTKRPSYFANESTENISGTNWYAAKSVKQGYYAYKNDEFVDTFDVGTYFVKTSLFNSNISSIKTPYLATEGATSEGFVELIKSKDYWVGFDNAKIYAVSNVYENDTVKSGANGKVLVETNPVTEEKTTVSAGGTETVKVNDYFDAVYKVVPDSEYIVASFKVNGEEAELTDGVYTIPAKDAATAHNIEVEFEKPVIKSLSIANNETVLVSGASLANKQLDVVGYTEDGKEVSLSNSSNITVESDNKLVFDVENNKVSTTSLYGMATIKVTYDDGVNDAAVASAMFVRSVNKNYDTDANRRSKHINDGIDGPTTGSLSYSYNASATSAVNYDIRGIYQHSSTLWANAKSRTVIGWFYDKMDEQKSPACFNIYFANRNTTQLNNFSYSYTNIGLPDDDYKSDNSSTVDNVIKSKNYSPSKLATVKRTEGWHQVVATLKTSGVVDIYIDGVLVDSSKISIIETLSTKNERYSEIRAASVAIGQEKSLYGGFAVVDYSGVKENYKVTKQATNGTIEGDAVVAYGDAVEYTLVPADGFEAPETVEVVDYAKINTKTIPVTNGKFSLVPSDDTIIQAVFVEKTEVAPSVGSNTSSSTGAYNKTVTGVDGNPFTISADKSITAYATIDDGFGYDITEYGIEIEKGGKAIALRGVGTRYEGQFAIVAYGAAIATGEYKTRAYVKFGDETVYGAWHTISVN